MLDYYHNFPLLDSFYVFVANSLRYAVQPVMRDMADTILINGLSWYETRFEQITLVNKGPIWHIWTKYAVLF